MENLHLGTIGWSYNFWKGNFYPNKLPSKNFLTFYASKFNTVEVDNTFYRIPSENAVLTWKNSTPENFTFSLKFPGVITHIKMLKDCQRETNVFLKRTTLLEQKLGPLLLQFPPNFGFEHFDDLVSFLQKLPDSNRYVVEVRNKGFLNEEFYSVLKANNAALAWIDRPGMPQLDRVTSNFLYIRWEGDRKKINGTIGKVEADKREDLQAWAERIKPYLNLNIDFFGYFGKYYSGLPPTDVAFLSTMLA